MAEFCKSSRQSAYTSSASNKRWNEHATNLRKPDAHREAPCPYPARTLQALSIPSTAKRYVPLTIMTNRTIRAQRRIIIIEAQLGACHELARDLRLSEPMYPNFARPMPCNLALMPRSLARPPLTESTQALPISFVALDLSFSASVPTTSDGSSSWPDCARISCGWQVSCRRRRMRTWRVR